MSADVVREFADFLGELGWRWGLPPIACRVHGVLYLRAEPVKVSELEDALDLSADAVRDALAWLVDFGLVDEAPSGWRTSEDPWDLVVRALNERRRRELGPVLETLRRCTAPGRDVAPATRRQLAKLNALAEDLAAIDAQTARVSPTTLRRVVGVSGWAARRLSRFQRREPRDER